MSEKNPLTATPVPRDPLGLLRRMTTELDRVFDAPFGAFRWPVFRTFGIAEHGEWAPQIDVFERDNRLVTKVDLPGLKKEEVRVEVSDRHLIVSGERRNEVKESTDNVFRCERSFGSFYRAVPLPEGVKGEDIKATFAEGVLEVSIPLPAKPEIKSRTVPIEEPAKPTAAAA